MTKTSAPMLEEAVSESECELLRQIVDALRTLRYGSLLLTVHDGQLVGIQKTEKIRRKSAGSKP
jgi:hypothetical protein